jgi:predicted Zn finger-like uncharacterized protein
MIIQCKSCSKRFIVKDKDIPKDGRLVQCGYCSTKWHQKPNQILKNIPTSDNLTKNKPASNVLKASDGKNYKFLGNQWAELLPSGKTGIFAKKKIGKELDKLIGRKTKIAKKKVSLTKNFDPSLEKIKTDSGQVPDIYVPKNGIGLFGYFFLIIIISLSLVGIIKTFEDDWLNYFPQDQYIFDFINEQIEYVYEAAKNIFTIVKDLTDSY